ncbi:hypothetical protein [uncultured Negativibacillus sp.]|uniref:hypothetical protein n=1 Tax=uncultured Negativibacillus sp. TaxID=1980696 RepID=UPI0034548A1B
MKMHWINWLIHLLGTDQLFGIHLGFWIGMSAVLLIVVVMNILFWSAKPCSLQNHSHSQIRPLSH